MNGSTIVRQVPRVLYYPAVEAADTLDAAQLGYPAELPVVAHRDEILAALRHCPVIIVCGDTGSGKTTQLPKMALEAGFAAHGRAVACTQPRRLATVTMAERVASELQTPVGGLVGWQHRFGRKISSDTRVKFMTDGVLLAETRGDPLLRKYDCIIVDEAHERSLNVDFLLGILKRILTRRKDLRVIVSSATMDTARFSEFFGRAPVISVPGRLFPIEVRYFFGHEGEPQHDEIDLPRDVAAAVRELPREGDILVFLPGERDIRECAETLNAQNAADDIIPLLASLPAGEQQRAFRLSPRRRIVLATNVAETSVTIPGIRYVIDSGLARISRYVHRTQVQRLQIEPISQASARQRTGRCGRVGPGTCIRLYSEEDFASRDAYTPPEILRSSLAGVILTMLDLGLGDVAKFPFLEPPRPAMIAEGLRELIELGAIARNSAGEPCLSAIGRQLVRLPVEPRLARMMLAASTFATLPSAVPVIAAMSCDDPRRRPADEKEKALQAHAPFRVPESDFLGTLKLWNWWKKQSEELSQTKLRKLCKATYLSYPKMREWAELVRQLEKIAGRLGLDLANDNGGPDAMHRALLSGLLGRIGKWHPDDREYRGARGLSFVIHPSSALAKAYRRKLDARAEPERRNEPKAPRKTPGLPEWIMCGELVDTARLFAREVTGIDPAWIEAAAGSLAKRHCHSPEWDSRSGFVRATEQVTLYGLVIVHARRCDYSRYNPAGARDLFLRRGLVDGAFPQPPPEVRQNTALVDALRRRIDKLRRPELFDEDGLVRALDAAIPRDITNAPALRRWLRQASPAEKDAFRLRKSDWWPSDRLDDADYPDSIRIGNVKMRLLYRHAPEDPETDGVTCTVLKSQAAALRLWRSDWLVPGLLPEKLSWMLSVLPTAQRRALGPLDEAITRILPRLRPGAKPLEDAVIEAVRDEFAFRLSTEAWRRARLPDHLRVRFAIRDDADGRVLAASRDLECALTDAGVKASASSVPLSSPHDNKSEKFTSWTFGDLPEITADSQAGWKLEHYPALKDVGDGVTVQLFARKDEALRAHAEGVLRLYLLALGERAVNALHNRAFSLAAQMHLKTMNYDAAKLSRDILIGAARAVLVRDQPPVRSAAEFNSRLESKRTELIRTQAEMSGLVIQAVNGAAQLLDEIERDDRLPAETAESIQTQLVWLTCPGFPRTTPLASLRRYACYLKGIAIRLQRARVGRSADLVKEARFAPWWTRYRDALQDRSPARPSPESLERLRWLLEEFRISVFAQELRTAEPVSEKRLESLLTSPA